MHRTYILMCFLVATGSAAQIKFYDSLNFTGLFFEINESPAGCSALPSYGHGMTSSLITDTCIILHQEANCDSPNKIKLPKGEHDNLKGLGFGEIFNAFELCSEAEGGEGLNVDLYYTNNYNDLAVKYSNVCGCIDMPNYIGTRQIISVNNHGNCVKLFEEQGCSGKMIELPGGSNAATRNLAIYFGVPTRSISSCDDHFACLRLESKIYKFELTSAMTKADILSSSSDFELAAKSTFRNNGSAVVTQEYQASKKIVESIEIFRSEALSVMTRVETAEELEWGVEVGVKIGPFSASTSLREKFSEAHTMERNSTTEESTRYFSEETREFSVSQTIQINPCTLYEVSSVVKFMEDYPVDYTIYAKVSGVYAGLRLSAANIKDRISSMEYIGDFDDFTVLAKTTGTMKADFGLESLIDGEGIPIEGCQV